MFSYYTYEFLSKDEYSITFNNWSEVFSLVTGSLHRTKYDYIVFIRRSSSDNLFYLEYTFMDQNSKKKLYVRRPCGLRQLFIIRSLSLIRQGTQRIMCTWFMKGHAINNELQDLWGLGPTGRAHACNMWYTVDGRWEEPLAGPYTLSQMNWPSSNYRHAVAWVFPFTRGYIALRAGTRHRGAIRGSSVRLHNMVWVIWRIKKKRTNHCEGSICR